MSAFFTNRKNMALKNPKFVTQLLNNPLAGLLWLPIRIWVGLQWFNAGLHKIESPAWVQTGVALKGFWMGVVAIPATGSAPIHYAWYRAFLQMMLNAQAYTWFAKLVAFGEAAIGIAMILGIFTGFAALMGGFMNFNFMMAGSASVNPMFFALSVLLVAAWKVSGYFGADFFLFVWVKSLLNRKQVKTANLPVRTPTGAEA
jgi:thiosulfate dehydrogenase [quinone] large subunit